MSTVHVDGATIAYTESGTGPPVVFVHGAYVTGALWDDVARRLSDTHRCIAPTWPFGAQRTPLGEAVDLSVEAAGRRIPALLEALDLSDVTLVANDTGGGIVLAALGAKGLDWSRVSQLVFTNCDSYEHFPPAGFAPMVRLCRLNRFVGAALMRLLTTPPGLKVFIGAVTKDGIDADRRAAIFGGFLSSAAVRRDAVRFTADLQPRHTMAAAGAIEEWTKPVLFTWGDADDMFPLSHARRLADAFPNARLERIAGSSTYVMLDRPEQTAALIRQFLGG
ncbi:alpha/beta hydrolase [Mycobacterium sp. 21AC1]|uniref:alpha/beta fold hydrolase n=1 Tax=[Mycobacterium] appelbergii TaxID=2939269 RepID=UPI0029390AC1|nr:alpha/beta hydrolase [Mycobacterium sp. 21AC1]MDV3124518.1 alpha/beta hydrolase [Mycobacterium sp. 21AC1]